MGNKLVVFVISQEQFALPIDHVIEIIRVGMIRGVPHTNSVIAGVINLRGQIMPVFDLQHRLAEGHFRQTEDSRIIVVRHQDELVGITVDRVLHISDYDEKVVKPVPEILDSVKHTCLKAYVQSHDKWIGLMDLELVFQSEEGRKDLCHSTGPGI